MSELNQKEVDEQMYLFVKQWLDNLSFEESKKAPIMAIGYCLARLSKQDALLKEQEAHKFFVDESGKITPLPVVVRCKDCIYRGNSEKCVLSAISEEKDFPLFMLDNRGDWFCADGVAKDTTVLNK